MCVYFGCHTPRIVRDIERGKTMVQLMEVMVVEKGTLLRYHLHENDLNSEMYRYSKCKGDNG